MPSATDISPRASSVEVKTTAFFLGTRLQTSGHSTRLKKRRDFRNTKNSCDSLDHHVCVQKSKYLDFT